MLVRVRPQELGHGLLLLVQLRGLNVHNRVLDGAAKTVRVNTYVLEDGKWELVTGGGSALPSLRPGFPPDSQSERKFFLPTFSYKKK